MVFVSSSKDTSKIPKQSLTPRRLDALHLCLNVLSLQRKYDLPSNCVHDPALETATKRKQEDTKIQQTFSGNLNALVAGMLFFQSIAQNPSPNQDDHDGTRPNSVVAVLDPSWKVVVSCCIT